MATKNTITIEIKNEATLENIDAILKKMLNALGHDELSLLENATLTCLVASVEKENGRTDADIDDCLSSPF